MLSPKKRSRALIVLPGFPCGWIEPARQVACAATQSFLTAVTRSSYSCGRFPLSGAGIRTHEGARGHGKLSPRRYCMRRADRGAALQRSPIARPRDDVGLPGILGIQRLDRVIGFRLLQGAAGRSNVAKALAARLGLLWRHTWMFGRKPSRWGESCADTQHDLLDVSGVRPRRLRQFRQ